jgi:hypothetical protein
MHNLNPIDAFDRNGETGKVSVLGNAIERSEWRAPGT